MELKNYQQSVMQDLRSFLNCCKSESTLQTAWRKYWHDKDIPVGIDGVPAYRELIPSTPHICMKIPTGGGKTFLACNAIKPIFDALSHTKHKAVVWLVPSDPILMQTVENLSDPNHPYRRKLDADFGGKVGIYTKDMLLYGHQFSPDTVREMLTVCILSYASLRIDSSKEDIRNVYKENGNLYKFASYFTDSSVLLEGTPDTALIQVLRHLNPVVVVDESHNATSDLSVQMLNRLNPKFILELTATPRINSNIISYIDARALKKENMVKLPVIVYNRHSRQDVIQDALAMQKALETMAETGGSKNYIRPIVLFQAQPKKGQESDTYDKIKSTLIDIGIPEEQIAIRVSGRNDLKGINLMDPSCKIRYIVTVNALKEGWDCPFAYILASLANKSSQVDVEQIVGRILRLPYATKNKENLLNASYVLTSSNDFQATLQNIVAGLNRAGFEDKVCLIGEDTSSEHTPDPEPPQKEQPSLFMPPPEPPSPSPADEDAFSDIDPSSIRISFDDPISTPDNSGISSMLHSAADQERKYEENLSRDSHEDVPSSELLNMVKRFPISPQFAHELDFAIPQFVIESAPSLFSAESVKLLDKDDLLEGFSLRKADIDIDFALASEDMWQIDFSGANQKDGTLKKMFASDTLEAERIRQHLARLPQEQRIASCEKSICNEINRDNRFSARDIKDYVHRIVSGMTDNELSDMEVNVGAYAKKILKKIKVLQEEYRRKRFFELMDIGKIGVSPMYFLKPAITPSISTSAIPKSLYREERNDMNPFEEELISRVTALRNVEWWHRIVDRDDFVLNGFINHYPDFMVRTSSGRIVLIEAKGPQLDGSDSVEKLKLGTEWAARAGNQYKYFMVFPSKELPQQGAYSMDDFLRIMKML